MRVTYVCAYYVYIYVCMHVMHIYTYIYIRVYITIYVCMQCLFGKKLPVLTPRKQVKLKNALYLCVINRDS